MSLKKTYLTVIAASVFFASAVHSDESCPSANLLGGGMLSNVCWSCIFPIKVMGTTLFKNNQTASSSDVASGVDIINCTDHPGGCSALDTGGFSLSSRPKVPPNAADKSVCVCTAGAFPKIGFSMGSWLPATVYETTQTPGCSSFFFGTTLGISDPLYMGTAGDPTEDLAQQSMVHLHTYSYPVVQLMELFTKCEAPFADIDALYLSEIDPTWNDPVVAMFGNPMSVFGASLTAMAACSADAISSSVGNPIDELFWCGGAINTTLAPYTGYNHGMGPMQYTSAASMRLLAMNHVRGLEQDTTGNGSLCEAQYDPILQKSAYRWQVAWPNAEGTRNHGFGETLLRWAAGRWIPGAADFPIYLLWKWTDCCVSVI